MDLLRPSQARSTMCEFKGVARYLDAVVTGRQVEAVAWSYADPAPPYRALRDYIGVLPEPRRRRLDGRRSGHRPRRATSTAVG